MREERNSEDVGSPCDHGYPVTIKVSIVGPGGMGMGRAYTLALKGVVRAPLDVRADHLDDVADFEVVVISASVPMNIDLKDRNAQAGESHQGHEEPERALCVNRGRGVGNLQAEGHTRAMRLPFSWEDDFANQRSERRGSASKMVHGRPQVFR